MTTFVDTNVLVYAHDTEAGRKHDTARSMVADLWSTRSGVLSTQVLQEFYVTVTRKLPRPMPHEEARRALWNYAQWAVHTIGADDVLAAAELESAHSVSFWDALIITAASRAGTSRLLSEDMQDGRSFSGVRIENPFTG